MGITQHKKHFLLVDKQISIDYLRTIGHYLTHDFRVVYISDMKPPIITTRTDKGEHKRIEDGVAAIDFTAKNRNKKKTVIIVTPEASRGNSSCRGNSVLHEQKQCFSLSMLAEYEREIGRISDESIEAIVCCYSEKWIESLSFADTIHLLNSHSSTIHKGWFFKPWNQQTFMASITAGIEESLGSGSSYLLMKTLHHIYKIDEDVILGDPQVFEEKTKRMFGKNADSILDAISRKLTEKISFNNNNARNSERWAIAQSR